MGRGRGHGNRRGRGGGGRFGQKRSHSQVNPKDASHLKQFGESHPSNDDIGDFGSSKKQKKFHNQQQQNPSFSNNEKYPNNDDTSDSESEEEEETTPYTELVNLFSGNKKSKQVQIVSESEEEEEEEDEGAVDEEQQSDDDDDESTSSDEVEVDNLNSHETFDNQDRKKTVVKSTKSEEKLVKSDKNKKSDEEQQQQDVDDDEELIEETVIGEAEIDPEANDDNSLVDPFLLHFEREIPENVQTVLKSKGKIYHTPSKVLFPILNQVQYSGIEDSNFLKDHQSDDDDSSTSKKSTDIISCLDKKRKKIPIPRPPHPTKSTLLDINNFHIKSQIESRIGITNQECLDKESCPGPLTPLQNELVYLASQYYDVYYPERTMNNQDEIRMAYCVHVANHVLKTRTRILHHNAKMASKVEVPEEFRDQGFVRPKVLILVPFKESALRIVKILISLILADEKGSVANKKRFVEEYGGTTLFMPKTNPKPADYMATFEGNVDDNFRLGMSITKKSIKLFTDFYSSDIIIASPLGLRIIIGAEGEKGRDYDFLSSIELTVMDQADVFLMQNWDHVIHLFKHLHLQPITTHGTDFGRIRPWALDGLSKFYSQTLVFSSVNCVELSALFSRHCRNFGGLVKVVNPIIKGSICQITVQLPQVYQQFDCSSHLEMSDARFDYFTKKVLPNFTNRLMSQTLIFVSSYFDFVRLRNHFKREEMSFVQICEYTKDKKIARSRDLFFHNENHFLLYTERAMFFRRLRLKGIGHIIFYELPQYAHFYSELCNSIQEDFQSKRVKQRKNSSVTTIYCQYDAPRLAAVVGSERATYMLTSDKKVHAFVTGEI